MRRGAHYAMDLKRSTYGQRLTGLIERAAFAVSMDPTSWVRMVLAREAVYTLMAAKNRPLRIVPGGRLWRLDGDRVWRVACVSDGTDEFIAREQAGGLPDFISPGGVAVVGLWVGHGVDFVVAHDHLCWSGRAPQPCTPSAWLENLLRTGVNREDLDSVAAGSGDDGLSHPGTDPTRLPRDACREGRGAAGPSSCAEPAATPPAAPAPAPSRRAC